MKHFNVHSFNFTNSLNDFGYPMDLLMKCVIKSNAYLKCDKLFFS